MAGNTIVVTARQHDDGWWIDRNGRAAGHDPVCLYALLSAVRKMPGNDLLSVAWASPPDSSIPQAMHDRLTTIHAWRQLLNGQ